MFCELVEDTIVSNTCLLGRAPGVPSPGSHFNVLSDFDDFVDVVGYSHFFPGRFTRFNIELIVTLGDSST